MREKVKLSFNKILGIFLLLAIAFSIIRIVNAVAPNPGHNFTEVSGGVATGNLLYGSATDVLSALASVAAGSYLRSAGVGTAPVWSTPTLPNTATNLKLLIGNATNWVESTPAYPNAAVTAGKVIVSDGTNYIASTPTFPNASAAARKIIVSDATNWIASTETYAVPGTSGNVLKSDGTNWISAAPTTQNGLLVPMGLHAANLTTVTALTTNVSYFLYLGKVTSAVTSCSVQTRVATAAATITWAEVGIFTGTPVIGGAASLSRVGFTNVAATFNSVGIKTTVVTVSGVAIGNDLWAAFGSQATTPYQTRGLLADDIQSGVFQTFAGRISTMTVPSATTLASATQIPAWLTVRCT